MSWRGRNFRREIAEAEDLMKRCGPVFDEGMEKQRKATEREFAAYRPKWRELVARHHWRRAIEAGLAEMPLRFTHPYDLSSDRYAAIGGGVDMVAARLNFGRELAEAVAPCEHARKQLGLRAQVLALEDGCCCEFHSPEIENFCAPLGELDALLIESLDSGPF